MARLLGPDMGSRLAYDPDTGRPARNATAVVYTNSAGTVLADIRAYDGSMVPGAVISGSTVATDAGGLLPLFWYPEGDVDRLYASVDGGPVTPIDADYNARLDGAVGKSTVTAKGDLLVATASGTVARLGVGLDGRVLTADATQAGGMRWALPPSDAVRSLYVAGQYYFPWSPDSSGTSATSGNGTLRLVPVLFPAAVNISHIGIEITAAGDAASTFRPVVYADNGTGYPGALLLDAGGLAAGSTGFKEAIVATSLSGLVWMGGVVQGVTTTQPTIRTGFERPIVPLRVGTTIVNAAGYGYQQTGVTGTPPGPFSSTVSVTGQAPRLFVKVA